MRLDRSSPFASTIWPGLLGVDPDELATLHPLLVPFDLANDEVFVDAGATPRGVFFVMGGSLAVAGRLSNGMLSEPIIFGKGTLFGEASIPGVSTVPQRIWGIRGARGLLLRREDWPAAVAAVPDLAAGFRTVGVLRRAMITFATAIRRDERFEGMTISAIIALLQNAGVRELAAGQVLIHGPGGGREGDPVDGLHMLVSGCLEMVAPTGGGERVERVLPGMLFGGLASRGSATEPCEVRATELSIVATIPLQHLHFAMYGSPTLRRRSRLFPALRQAGDEAAVILAFHGDAGKPMAAITRLLAQAARDEYRDRITLLTLDPEPKGGVHARPKLTEGAHGVRLATLGIPTDPAGARAAFSSVLQLAIDTDYLLVDPSRLHPDILAALAADFPRLVYLTGDGFEAPPLELPAGRVSWAVQLGEHRPLTHPAFRPGTTRVRFDDVAGLARITDVDQLSKADRARLLRWWRALSERRVGLALGGGGAWGYAHTTLIRRMVQAGIPIDAVAGSSFGSLCGAFYCVLQDDDWCKDLEVYGPKAERDTRLAFFTSAVLERGVDGALLGALAARGRPSKHAPRLEDLEVPLLPVATNIGSGSEAVVSLGTVGWGVRCSSSFPGIFAPTTGKGFRYVDGGIIRNVPTDPLVGEGLDLVIASNIVPNPQYAASSSPRFKGRVGRLLHELNPIGRLDDLVRSSLILMHAAGDAVAWEADVVFNSEPVRESPGGFSAGASIAEQALPGVEQALPLIQAKWQAMKDRT